MKNVENGQIYRNKKTGNHYVVLAIGKHSETQEEVVIYERTDLTEDNTVWVRPMELFKEKFEVKN